MICPPVALALAKMVVASRGLMVNGSITRIFFPIGSYQEMTSEHVYQTIHAKWAADKSILWLTKHWSFRWQLWNVDISLMSLCSISTRGQCRFTFLGQHISSSKGLMQSDTCSNHSHHITVRLAHHLWHIYTHSYLSYILHKIFWWPFSLHCLYSHLE